jgi:hypothetical protein
LLDMYEWIIEAFRSRSKEQLLLLEPNHPEMTRLRQFSHEDVLLELCALWVARATRTISNTTPPTEPTTGWLQPGRHRP